MKVFKAEPIDVGDRGKSKLHYIEDGRKFDSPNCMTHTKKPVQIVQEPGEARDTALG